MPGSEIFYIGGYIIIRAAITPCHTVCGLKQQKYILLRSWRPEICTKVWAGL